MNDTGPYLNREISDLQFIERVLEESCNETHPLFEQLRFLSISASVLDQFYTVRVAKLKRSQNAADSQTSIDGLTELQQLAAIDQRSVNLMLAQQKRWETLVLDLAQRNLLLVPVNKLNKEDTRYLKNHFDAQIAPLLDPYSLDEEHPFPFISSGGICAILEYESNYLLVPFPRNLHRFIRLPGNDLRFILLEEVIFAFYPDHLPPRKIVSHGLFQILRDNDLALEERSRDLRTMIESGLRLRHKANVTLLKLSQSISQKSARFLMQELGMINPGVRDEPEPLSVLPDGFKDKSNRLAYIELFIGISQLTQIIELTPAQQSLELCFKKYHPRYPRRLVNFEYDLFATISNKDLLVHWPYESFDVLVKFLDQAANDADVLSIKQTLYRTGKNSPIVQSLIKAAENGKTVMVVIELEARDDEEPNIQLAKRLELAGAHIVYGIVGLKVHCKASLIIRREKDQLISYCHLGTGNYHSGNARTYTDLSFFTRDAAIGKDLNCVFNYLSSNHLRETEKLIVSPVGLRDQLYGLIDNEIENAERDKPAEIWIKLNSLTDQGIIDKLYQASRAGVHIQLVIRRHCSLRPGVKGLSENIRVKSILGRFLEHSRVYCFANGEQMNYRHARVYISSADWMKRNLDERVEIMLPLEDIDIKQQIVDQIMKANLIDTLQSWHLDSTGEYKKASSHESFSAQSWFMNPDYYQGELPVPTEHDTKR